MKLAPIPKRTATILIVLLVVDAVLILWLAWFGPQWRSAVVLLIFVPVAVMDGAIILYAVLPRQRELRRARHGKSDESGAISESR